MSENDLLTINLDLKQNNFDLDEIDFDKKNFDLKEDDDSDTFFSLDDEDFEDYHKLQYKYNFWYSKRCETKESTSVKYKVFVSSLKVIGSFQSVEKFWSVYSYLLRPNLLPTYTEIHVFKHNIKPMWEDIANIKGGKWCMILEKKISPRIWENLVLAVLGEQFSFSEEICGIVISIRKFNDVISLWNRNAKNKLIILQLKKSLERLLNLPSNFLMQYITFTKDIKYFNRTLN